MIDQLIIGNHASFDDFGASVKSRKKSAPVKKSIRETVPFSNKTYDFSGINGEIYWEERELEYVFEIMADSPEQLEEKKTGFIYWVMNAMKAEIHDPFIKYYHFVGTYSSLDEDDSEVEKSTITVLFEAYPYMVADEPKRYSFSLGAGDEKTVDIINDSSHRITPTILSEMSVTIVKDNASYSIPAGNITDDSFKLSTGLNKLTIRADEAGKIAFQFREEVF